LEKQVEIEKTNRSFSLDIVRFSGYYSPLAYALTSDADAFWVPWVPILKLITLLAAGDGMPVSIYKTIFYTT
jgi:hypothetical protein